MFKPKLKPFTNSNQENPDKANTKKKKIYKILIGIGILLVMALIKKKKIYKILIGIGILLVMALIIFLIVKIVSSEPESDASVTDTFADETKIYSKTNVSVSGGQVMLALMIDYPCGGATGVQDASSTVYNIVEIGGQCWMAQNLDYDNGCSSNGWVDSTDTGWCGYYDGAGSDDTYGLLYQWSAAMNGTTTEEAQGICPAGWKVPSHNDWTDLERQICSDIGNSSCDTTFPYNTSATGYLGDGEAPAMAASTTLWTDDLLVQDTTNFATSGLDVFPAGYRGYSNGTYDYRNSSTLLWSSTEDGAGAWTRNLHYHYTGVSRDSFSKAGGFSVRCLRDWTCGDPLYYEGKNYDTVSIGDQCWMAQNLDYDNGCSSKGWVNESDTGWCGYYDDAGSDETYGLLYQWSAAMNGTTTEGAQGICPAGWYLPTDADYTTLTTYLDTDSGSKMAGEYDLWTDGALRQSGDFGSSGLDVFPAGYRSYVNGDYLNRSSYAYLWSSTENGTLAWRRILDYNSTGVYRTSLTKAYGFSVRCLRQ